MASFLSHAASPGSQAMAASGASRSFLRRSSSSPVRSAFRCRCTHRPRGEALGDADLGLGVVGDGVQVGDPVLPPPAQQGLVALQPHQRFRPVHPRAQERRDRGRVARGWRSAAGSTRQRHRRRAPGSRRPRHAGGGSCAARWCGRGKRAARPGARRVSSGLSSRGDGRVWCVCCGGQAGCGGGERRGRSSCSGPEGVVGPARDPGGSRRAGHGTALPDCRARRSGRGHGPARFRRTGGRAGRGRFQRWTQKEYRVETEQALRRLARGHTERPKDFAHWTWTTSAGAGPRTTRAV